MKKVLVMLVMVLFSCVPANATYQLFFNAGGVPISRAYGGGMRRSINNFGSNAGFTPRNIRREQARRRAIARENAITNAINSMGRNNSYNGGMNSGMYANYSQRSVNRTAVVEQSRFDRNYTPARTTRSYTRNGVTYYN